MTAEQLPGGLLLSGRSLCAWGGRRWTGASWEVATARPDGESLPRSTRPAGGTRRGNCADQQPGDCPDVPTDPSGDVFGDGALSGRVGVGSPGRPRSPTSNASAAAARTASHL